MATKRSAMFTVGQLAGIRVWDSQLWQLITDAEPNPETDPDKYRRWTDAKEAMIHVSDILRELMGVSISVHG